jgi:putative PIN family toxin of toxin-antitoxin system
MIPRVVLDTNVVVSALLKPDSLEDQVLRLGLAGRLRLCLSAETLAEYALVLPRPKFKLQPGEVKQALARLRGASTMFSPVRTLGVSKDDPDNRFLECAEAAEATYGLVSQRLNFASPRRPPPVPFRGLLVSPRQRQHGCFRERCTGDLQADGQAGRSETARNGDRRQPVNIEGRGIARRHRIQARTLRDRYRRARHRGRDHQVHT